jgi:signal transduction histidine kinase
MASMTVREARLEAAARRASFLAAASSALAESLDYRRTLRTVAELAVPTIADWCTVTVIDADGALQRVAVVHSDPAREALTREYMAKFPPGAHRASAFADIARDRKAVLVNDVGDELVAAVSQGEDHLRVLRGLGVKSCIMVPLASERAFIGVISFMLSDTPRTYGPEDLELAQDLAARAGLAVENARLYEEQRQAVALRDTFLSVASHELRTPLTALRLRVELVDRTVRTAEGDLAERLRPQIASMQTQIERLDGLASVLLDVSRIVSGRLHVDVEDVDVAPIVRDVVARFADASIAVAAPESLTLRTDPTRFEQIAVNLVDNAVKYGEGRPIEVAVEATPDLVVLAVTDRGIGVPETHRARIFERFERAVSARNYAGLGLGLFIVRSICEALGGRIELDAAPDRTTFRVTLPREPHA